MVSISWNKKKLNSLNKKINKLCNDIPKAVEEGLKNGLEGVKELAYTYKRGTKEGIMIAVSKENSKEILGRIYTDKTIMPYALFLEYGTGIYAEMEHIGTTKTFIESGYRYWYLPVEKAQRDFGSSRKVTIGDSEFYIMYAQRPAPFMKPASFYGRTKLSSEIQKTLSKIMKEISI